MKRTRTGDPTLSARSHDAAGELVQADTRCMDGEHGTYPKKVDPPTRHRPCKPHHQRFALPTQRPDGSICRVEHRADPDPCLRNPSLSQRQAWHLPLHARPRWPSCSAGPTRRLPYTASTTHSGSWIFQTCRRSIFSLAGQGHAWPTVHTLPTTAAPIIPWY